MVRIDKLTVYFDKRASEIEGWAEEHDMTFGQFRTPLTQYAKGNLPWILDNGCFTEMWSLPNQGPVQRTFIRMMIDAQAPDSGCQFIVVPDFVGDSDATLSQFFEFIDEYPLPPEMTAYVAQDGQLSALVPWEDIGCLFIGGTDRFKGSVQAYQLAIEAKKRNKWVHVGRVNTTPRIVQWYGVADSIDGSGISRFTWMREKLLKDLKDLHRVQQTSLKEWC